MAISLIQQMAAANHNPDLGADITAGNSVIAILTAQADRTISSVTGCGVTWTRAVQQTGTNRLVEIWYGHNSSGAAGSGTDFVATASGPSFSNACHLSEWSGLGNAGAEATNTNTGTSDSPTTNSVTPTSTDALIIAGMSTGTYSSGPINSFTRLNNATSLESAYRIVSSIAAYSTGITYTGSSGWAAAIAAFGDTGAPAANNGNFFAFF